LALSGNLRIDAQKNYWQNFKATGLDRRQLFRWQFSISAGAAHEGYSVQRCPRFGKSKYLFSNLYWQDLEEKYHFSLQFTADLIAMNAANLLLAAPTRSTFTPDSVGQYESYKCFTMPDLYHVVNGIELFSPKFNVVPRVNENYYFPYSHGRSVTERSRTGGRNALHFGRLPQIFGLSMIPTSDLFSMARLDRIKTSLVWRNALAKRGTARKLQLILVAGS